MLTIAIPQLYCGASGQKGAYNRQEVGLARAFASLGARAVVLYPDPRLEEPEVEDLEPGVRVYYCPARTLGVNAFYRSWDLLLREKVDAVHLMGDNSLGVPGLYRFCRRHRIFFYNQLGVLRSSSENPLARPISNLLCARNLSIYRRTPTYAKTPAVADQLRQLRVPCAGVMPVGLDTAIIPTIMVSQKEARAALGLDQNSRYLLFVGRLDGYKRPLDLVPVLAALPASWKAVVIGDGALAGALDDRLRTAGLESRCRRIRRLGNTAVQVYYHACDVFLSLNDREIFGMSLLEAMYAGCPPVARHAPGPDMLIEDGVSGLLTGEDTDAIAAAVQTAALDPALGPAAQKRINEHFLWSNSAETALAMLAGQGVGRRRNGGR